MSIKNIDFHYSEFGSKDNPAVLMLHGFMGSSQDYASIASVLDNDYYCLAIDLPGHGDTIVNGADDYYSMEKIAEGIIEFLIQKKINRCHLVSYSMGGRLGLYLAIKYPEYFDKVILESVSPGLKTDKERRERIEQDQKLARKILDNDFKEFITTWYRQPLFASLRRDEIKLKRMMDTRRENKEGYALSLHHMGTGVQPSLWKELKKIKSPTLLLAGELDVKFKAIAKEMVVSIPGANLNIIPDAGHNIHFEVSETYLRIVKDFLTNN
ncbi:MAG: 2-succinyl-6-hydroxy-2,4-cyclohexadiene-1-carboxylate synthase [bacterium]